MTTSLDTSVLIDVANGRSPRLRARFLEAWGRRDLFKISAIAFHEMVFGWELSGSPISERQRFEAVFWAVPVEPFSDRDAAEAGRLRAELRLQGREVNGFDVLIGGQARARGWAVATGNLKHFNRMPNLVVEDWSA